MAGAAAVALVFGSVAFDAATGSGIDTAHAAQDEGQGKQMRGGQGGGAGQGQGGMQKGGQEGMGGGSGSRLEEDVMRGQHGRDEGASAADEDEDSDRPDWAGRDASGEKPGGGNQGGSTQKGGDYGDLWVIVRNDDGTPALVDGMVQVVLSDGTVVALADYDGELPEEYADMVQEVEFGRMNIARSPDRVLDHSLTEALTKLDGMVITTDNLDVVTDESGRLIDYFDNTIDSPLENLALYKALLEASATAPDADGLYSISVTAEQEGGETMTLDIRVSPEVLPSLAASALAASSDKTGDLTADEIMYISGFLGVDDELAALVDDDPNDAGDAFFTYDRDAVYAGTSVQVLLPNDDGTAYIPTTVYVVDTDVNGDGEYTALDTNGDGVVDTLEQGQVAFNDVPSIVSDDDGIDVFTQAADDSVQVLEYVHDNAVDMAAPEVTN